MKKIILLGTSLLLIGAPVMAQKSKVRTATSYLEDNNYRKAIPEIDEAVADESTKGSAQAWYVRGMAYLQRALDSTAKSPESVDVAYSSFQKALELDPAYDASINNPMYSTAIMIFNRAVGDYSRKDYANAYNNFMKVVSIYNISGGKRFRNNPQYADRAAFGNLATNAQSNAAYSAMNNKQYDQAAELLEEISRTQTQKDSNVYQSLVEIYLNQNKADKLGTTLTEARRSFPNSVYFRDQELNYYIRSGRQSELTPRLEAAVAQDPNNPELLFNLANAYSKMAFPVDAQGKAMPAPANADEYATKSEETYKKLLAIRPDNADYNYNTAIIYYSRASAINKQLMEIKGNTPAETKRYDALLAQRNAEFDKALPYFDRAYTILDPRAGSLEASDKETYRNAMVGLREIYSRKNNKAKTDELAKKINGYK